MGLEIGFDLYKKEPLDKEGKFIEADIETPWVCGRTETTYSWGEEFTFNQTETITPVFQKGLKDKVEKLEEYSEKYSLITLEEFKEPILKAIKEAINQRDEDKLNLVKDISKYEKEIKELRELQKTCTEDQEFAFNKWEEKIEELKEKISYAHESYDEYDDEDYDYTHALWVKDLLEKMEEYLKEDKYYVVPFYSY